MKLNPNKKIVKKIIQEIKENNGYCPCMIIKNNDTKCPCKNKRENSICVCGLYIDD